MKMNATELKKFNNEKRKSKLARKSWNKKHESQPVQELQDLPNNWSRYDINEENETVGASFESLLQEPISSDSYFKFKSEHNWDAEITSELNLNENFTLDLKLLNEGISTIPFHKRHNYDASLFSPLELESIKKQTNINLKKYNNYLSQKFTNKESEIIIINNSNELKTNNVETIKLASETTEIKQNSITTPITVEKQNENKRKTKAETQFHDHVDDLLSLKFSQQQITEDESEIKVENPLPEQTEVNKIGAPQSVDLEQWLDDILDD